MKRKKSLRSISENNNMEKLIILGNGVDWCEKSLCGFKKYNHVVLFNDRQIVRNRLLRSILKIQYSKTINKQINVPFKRIWYKSICQSIGLNNDCCVLIYDHNPFGGDNDFLSYIRNCYPKVRLAYIFTNVVKFSAAYEMRYLDKLNQMYEVVFAFDPMDARNFNFSYSPLIYDADDSINASEEISGVFYVGQAKDRFKLLIDIFERLKMLNIRRDFHIVNVSDAGKVHSDEIKYNKYITYDDAVKKIKSHSCLVDVIQGNSEGLTIKVCEAVCYNKKLITTNKHVVDYPFYDSRFILVIDKPEDISKEFFENNIYVEYTQEGKEYFSADNFLKRLKKELSSLE